MERAGGIVKVRLAICLIASTVLLGCTHSVIGPGTSFRTGQDIPATTVAGTGGIQGFVYRDAEKREPFPGALVFILGQGTFTGNPKEPGIAQSEEFSDPNNRLKLISVFHDFRDGNGPVLTERRFKLQDNEVKYLYFRPGEYILIDIPPGNWEVGASFHSETPGGSLATKSPVPVQVKPGVINYNTDIILQARD
jgi:hypothetical protein